MNLSHGDQVARAQETEKIVIVDDNDLFRHFMVRLLSSFGYDPVDVPDIEALRRFLCEIGRPRLVFLDWQFKNENSLEAFLYLKQMDIPVVVISGDLGSVDSRVDHVLAKPFDSNSLRSVIQELLI